MSERIRHSCTEYFMRRIHNIFFKMNPTDFDQEAFKVIKKRTKFMSTKFEDPEGKREPRAAYSDKQLDESLYHISVSMINNLGKEETPSAKRKLINEALQLALDALHTVKAVPGADDEDYLYSYIFYQVYARKPRECRLFSQLHFTILFDVESDPDPPEHICQDACRRFFDGLFLQIRNNNMNEAMRLTEESDLLMI